MLYKCYSCFKNKKLVVEEDMDTIKLHFVVSSIYFIYLDIFILPFLQQFRVSKKKSPCGLNPPHGWGVGIENRPCEEHVNVECIQETV